MSCYKLTIQLRYIIVFASLVNSSLSHVCTDDWELVYLREGPVCWSLLSVPDFTAGYATAVKVCDVANAKGVQVQNAAEKGILADIARKASEPTLTCYKVSQTAVEGEWKSVDHESSPEYLRKLNKEGKIRLEKKIETGDRITIVFSAKMPVPGSSVVLNGHFRISSSLNSSKYSIDVDCTKDGNQRQCAVKHPGLQGRNSATKFVQMTHEKLNLVSVETFGTITFDFLDKRINVLDLVLHIPDEHSYIGMDHIIAENVIVARVEHSKCSGTDKYFFESKDLNRDMPDRHIDDAHIPALRRSLGSNYTLTLPDYQYDFYKMEGKQESGNPWVLDVRMDGRSWNYVQVEFWNWKKSKMCHFKFDENGVLFHDDKTGKSEGICSTPGSAVRGHPILNMRFKITSSFENMEITMSISYIGGSETFQKQGIDHLRIYEIRLLSDKIRFFDAQMTSLKEAVVTTCNYRPMQASHTQETVPFLRECFKKRNVLCQRAAQDLPGEMIQNEEEAKRVWEEELPETTMLTVPTTSTSTAPRIETSEAPVLKESEAPRMFVEDIRMEDIGGFMWSIIGLTSLAAASFIAIFVLNIVRCAL